MLNLLGMVSMLLKGTLMADHNLVFCAVVLSNDLWVPLAENPKNLSLSLQHSVNIFSKFLWYNENLLVYWADEFALLWLHKWLKTQKAY